jgi:hypothetical protein
VKEFALYTGARLGLFLVAYAAVLGVVWLVGGTMHPVWPLLIAAALSTVASAFVLRDLRERFALQVQQRAQRMSQKFEEMKANEDVD